MNHRDEGFDKSSGLHEESAAIERTTSPNSLLIEFHGLPAGILSAIEKSVYRFTYLSSYHGPPVSVTMPVRHAPYDFDQFPPFFDGLLPEGVMLQGLLFTTRLNADDYLGQLLAVGADLVGAVTVRQVEEGSDV